MRELRVVVAAEEYDVAVGFYRDVLGMREQAAFAGPGGAAVTILDAGRATFEIANPAQHAYIDEVEVGRAVAPPIRLAFEVDDVAGVTGALLAAGATEVAAPRPTPFGSANARLEAPAGLQITLFERDKPAPAVSASGDLVIRDARPADWTEIWPFFRQIVAAGRIERLGRNFARNLDFLVGALHFAGSGGWRLGWKCRAITGLPLSGSVPSTLSPFTRSAVSMVLSTSFLKGP